MKSVFIFLLYIFTICSKSKSYNVTCDFDLVLKNPKILEFLPEDCAKLQKENNHVYDLALKEAEKFAEFYKKLQGIEESRSPDDSSPDFELRQQLYEKFKLFECQNRTQDDEFYNCFIDRRTKMIEDLEVINNS